MERKKEEAPQGAKQEKAPVKETQKEEAEEKEPLEQREPLKTEEKPSEKPSKEEELKNLAEDYKRKWYAVSAEYENYRKRTASDSARRYLEGRADVVKGLFPIADNLSRAIASCADEGTKKGIQMVIDSFNALLKEEKIEEIDPLGKPFDAEESEAIMAVDASDGEESGIVKQVYRKGYKQNGKVLRFAQVVVIK